MNKRLILPVIGLLAVAAIIAVPFFSSRSPNDSVGSGHTITMGIQTSPAMAVIMVAEDAGFFDEQGVNVELVQFSAGKFALQAMMGDSIDIAVAGEVPVGLALMQGNEVKVYAQAVRKTVNEVRVIARAETGTEPVEYFTQKRRKLATSLGGGPEFFTWSYLKDLGITEKQVEIIGQKPEDMPAALNSGSVDAIAIFDPFAYIAEQKGVGEVYTFPDRKVYSELYVLAAKPEYGDLNQDDIRAILTGMISAEIFISQYPDKAKEIVAKYTRLEAEVLNGIWDKFEFAPDITPQLLDYWNRQYDWSLETGKIESDVARPDYEASIDRRAFDSVLADAE